MNNLLYKHFNYLDLLVQSDERILYSQEPTTLERLAEMPANRRAFDVAMEYYLADEMREQKKELIRILSE